MATTVNDIHLIGLAAARPAAAASNKGYYYTATDSSGGTTYRSDGSTWTQIAGAVSGPSPSLTSASAALSGDVTMTNANTWYDGPSVSLAAGTWLIIAALTFTGAVSDWSARIWDGTTVAASGGGPRNAGGLSGAETITLAAIVTPGSTTTYKVSGVSDNAGDKIKAAVVTNGSGNNASWIVAVKIV